MHELNHGAAGKGDADRSPGWRKKYENIFGQTKTTTFRKVYRFDNSRDTGNRPRRVAQTKTNAGQSIARDLRAQQQAVRETNQRLAEAGFNTAGH